MSVWYRSSSAGLERVSAAGRMRAAARREQQRLEDGRRRCGSFCLEINGRVC